jgi:hypothetical protein
MEELRAALVAATRALRAAETEAQERAKIAAATGVRFSGPAIAGELADVRQAAGDLHRAVAVLVAGPAGHGV